MAFAALALPLLGAGAALAGPSLGLAAGTTAALSAGLGAAGAGIGAIGQIQQGQAQAAQARYEAQVAANNQAIASYNAARTTAAGEGQAYIQGLRAREALGAATAGMAAEGLDVNTGSARDVRTSRAITG